MGRIDVQRGLPEDVQRFIEQKPSEEREAAYEYLSELQKRDSTLPTQFLSLPPHFQGDLLKYRGLSREDSLTGLGNRRACKLYTTEMFSLLPSSGIERRKSTIADVGVLMIDVNSLGEVNNHLGHDVGDRVLVYTADAIRGSLHRGSDRGFRLGGDEYIVVAPNVDGALSDIAGNMKASFCQLAAKEIKALKKHANLDVAIGYALTEVYVDPMLVIGEADRAMYAEKTKMTGREYRAGA